MWNDHQAKKNQVEHKKLVVFIHNNSSSPCRQQKNRFALHSIDRGHMQIYVNGDVWKSWTGSVWVIICDLCTIKTVDSQNYIALSQLLFRITYIIIKKGKTGLKAYSAWLVTITHALISNPFSLEEVRWPVEPSIPVVYFFAVRRLGMAGPDPRTPATNNRCSGEKCTRAMISKVVYI